MGSTREHWDAVYGRNAPDQVSWYRPHLEQSLRFLDGARLGHDAAIIDVGGGASTFVDDVLARGYRNVTVLDVSARAVEAAQARLAKAATASAVTWLVADVTGVELPAAAYDFWHDRAVFHFLKEETDRRRYVASLRTSVKPGGYIVVATFGPEGPRQCSGLDVVRYRPDELHAQLGADLQEIGSSTEIHTTPTGREQQFVTCCWRVPD